MSSTQNPTMKDIYRMSAAEYERYLTQQAATTNPRATGWTAGATNDQRTTTREADAAEL